MKMSLQTRLLGTIIAAIVVFFLISVIAARITMQNDLGTLGAQEVTNGSHAFGGYWTSHQDQIKLLVAQDALSTEIRKDLVSGNLQALQDEVANDARKSGLSWLTIVDPKGKVIARATGTTPGSLAQNRFVALALTGKTVSVAASLPSTELAGEGLADQAASDVKGPDGSTVEHVTSGLSLIAAAPIADQNQRTIGAVYGGVLMNHVYDIVDEASAALGGQAALLEGDAIIASSIPSPGDGTRLVDRTVAPFATVAQNKPFDGTDTQGGTAYLVHIEPIVDDQNKVIGAQWYGVPKARIDDIINNTTRTLVLWGIVAALLALVFSIPIVRRLSKMLAERSIQVRRAAKELGVVMVGSEVSGDHVAMTKNVVEQSGAIIDELAKAGDPTGKVAQLKGLNDELSNDVIVIDTLSQEMSTRMQQAVDRVHELNDVAGALNALVTGEAN